MIDSPFVSDCFSCRSRLVCDQASEHGRLEVFAWARGGCVDECLDHVSFVFRGLDGVIDLSAMGRASAAAWGVGYARSPWTPLGCSNREVN